MYKASPSERTAVTFDTAKVIKQVLHLLSCRRLRRRKAKGGLGGRGSTMEIGHGFTDSQVEPDSHQCKIPTPQFQTCGTLPLIIIAGVTEILLVPYNWNY